MLRGPSDGSDFEDFSFLSPLIGFIDRPLKAIRFGQNAVLASLDMHSSHNV